MKTLIVVKVIIFFLIIMTTISFAVLDSAFARPPMASPYDESSGLMSSGVGNTTLVKAQEAAATAVPAPPAPATPSPSKIDPAITSSPVSTAPVVKPGVETNALVSSLSGISEPIKVNLMNSPISSAFRNEGGIGMNTAGDKTQAKDTPLKKTIVISPNTAPVSPVPTVASKEKPGAQEMVFKPETDKYAPSKEEIKMTDGLKAIINDLKQSDGSSDSPKAKELQDQLTKIADMMNSNQYNLNMPDRDARYASVAHLFKGLDNQKMVLMMKYTKATEPYYDKVRSMLIKNIKVIQAMGGPAKQMAEEDIKKMPRNEIDKLLEKLRKSADKTFETEYILQEEAKYQKEYLEPNIKKLTSDMVEAIGGFTEKMSEVIK